MGQYLDENGNPIQGTPSYLDDSGNPVGAVKSAPALAPSSTGIANQVLAKYGISVGPSPDQRRFAATGPAAQSVQGDGFLKRNILSGALAFGNTQTGAQDTLPNSGNNPVYDNSRQQISAILSGKNSSPNAPGIIGGTAADLKSGAQGAYQMVAGPAQTAGSGDIGGAVGEGAVTIPMFAAMTKAPIDLARSKFGSAAPVAKEDVVNGIYRAINPPVGDVRGFKSNLQSQLDTVLSHAKENGIDISTRDGFNQALQSAAAADPYRSTFIDPYKDTTVAIWPRYRGQTTLNGTHATIGQLDARLAAINDELYPRYQKGGAQSGAAQASINSGDARALGAEANQIRDMIAQTVGKQAGVDPATVRAARSNYEQMKSLAEDVQDSLNKENQDYNAKLGQPATIGSIPSALKNIPLNPRNWAANPTAAVRDRLFQGAVKNYQPSTPLKFDINPPNTQSAVDARMAMRQQRISNLLKNNPPTDLGAPPRNPLSPSAIQAENDWFQQAKNELGADAPISQVLLRAQALKQAAQ